MNTATYTAEVLARIAKEKMETISEEINKLREQIDGLVQEHDALYAMAQAYEEGVTTRMVKFGRDALKQEERDF